MDNVTRDKIASFENFLRLHRSEATIKSYINTVKRFFESMDKRYDEVTIDDIVNFLAQFENKKTVSVYAFALRAFYRYVGMDDFARKIPVPKPERAVIKYVTDEDLSYGLRMMDTDMWVAHYPKEYREVYRLRDKLLIILGYYLALRIGEAHKINRSDFIEDEKIMIVHREKTVEDQPLPLTDDLVILIKSYLKMRKDKEEAFFVCGYPPKRCSVEMLRLLFKKFARAIGKGYLTFHSLRHGRGTELARKDKDVLTIATWLHHRNPITSMIYIHLTAQDLRKKVLGEGK